MSIFDSNPFHESGPVEFSPGHENNRIDVRMLFGRWSAACATG
jgi:hypothetical protein